MLLACGPTGPDLPRRGDEPMLQIAQAPAQKVAHYEKAAPAEPATQAMTAEIAPELAALPAPQRRPLPDIAIPDQPASTPEPFGTPSAALGSGGMVRKWKAIQAQLPEDVALTGYCAVHPSACTRAISTFLGIVQSGRKLDGVARIEAINRAINQAIAPKTDMDLYGVEELWTTPLQTFAMGAGDCEDYAIAKYVALKMLGVAASDLRLLVVRDHAVNDFHAVAAVRHRSRWYILDNRSPAVRADTEIAEFDPLFALGDDGVRRVSATIARVRPSKPPMMSVVAVDARASNPVR